MATPTKPAAEYRLGRIKTTIWANHTAAGEVWFNVQVVRLYLEGNQWQESTSFGRDDLPIVAKAADMAFAWIWSQPRQQHTRNVRSTTPDDDIQSLHGTPTIRPISN